MQTVQGVHVQVTSFFRPKVVPGEQAPRYLASVSFSFQFDGSLAPIQLQEDFFDDKAQQWKTARYGSVQLGPGSTVNVLNARVYARSGGDGVFVKARGVALPNEVGDAVAQLVSHRLNPNA